MEAAMQIHLQEDDFILPQTEKIVVNKETSSAKKLFARRAIEDHLERKSRESKLESYYFD
ncbi:MAG: hypothetical protein RL217_767 [Pseudomonadota bacterium]|jgi:hypothetical protein